MAQGDELLIVDSKASDREGMRKLFEGEGYVCTAVDSGAEAAQLVTRKFFPVALIDLDVDGPGAGLDVVRALRERSEATGLILLTGRRTFEGAVEAYRLGVRDVVTKRPDQVEHLKEVVTTACDHSQAGNGQNQKELLREIRSVLDESFKIVLEMGRKQQTDASPGSGSAFTPRILIVDGDQAFLQEMAGRVRKKPWEIAAEMNGGSALDKAGEHRFHIIACRAELMDLGGSMVIKTVQSQQPSTLGLIYSASDGEGYIGTFRDGRMEDAERPFKGSKALVGRIESIVDMLGATARDRRVIQAFRSAHEDFFRRYAELKGRLNRILD